MSDTNHDTPQPDTEPTPQPANPQPPQTLKPKQPKATRANNKDKYKPFTW